MMFIKRKFMKKVVICSYKRTAFTLANKGALATLRPDDILAELIKAIAATINHQDIEDLLVGCAFPEAEQGMNLARIAGLLAGLPHQVPAVTINRFCGSSMQSIHAAAGAIAMGAGELFIAAGVESMSRIPIGGYNPMPNPKLYRAYPAAYMNMGITAENLAKKYNISREISEEFALSSHQKAAKADFSKEILAISGISEDGCIRKDANMASMAALAPAFLADGIVTAATSSPLTDGAAAVIIASEEYADIHGLSKLARIKSIAVTGCDAEIMGIGPVAASKKALFRAGIEAKDLDIIELNEAFAVQAIACINELGFDMDKINIEGGALALGHPLGASGARITGKAAELLYKNGGKYALATQCIGGGQGISTVLEAIGY